MAIRVKRANGERLIPDDKMTEYLAMGYSVIDDQGHVIAKPDPKTPAEFKAAMDDLKAKHADEIAERDKAIDACKEECAKLIAENDALKAAYKALETASGHKQGNSAVENETPGEANSGPNKGKATNAAK